MDLNSMSYITPYKESMDGVNSDINMLPTATDLGSVFNSSLNNKKSQGINDKYVQPFIISPLKGVDPSSDCYNGQYLFLFSPEKKDNDIFTSSIYNKNNRHREKPSKRVKKSNYHYFDNDIGEEKSETLINSLHDLSSSSSSNFFFKKPTGSSGLMPWESPQPLMPLVHANRLLASYCKEYLPDDIDYPNIRYIKQDAYIDYLMLSKGIDKANALTYFEAGDFSSKELSDLYLIEDHIDSYFIPPIEEMVKRFLPFGVVSAYKDTLSSPSNYDMISERIETKPVHLQGSVDVYNVWNGATFGINDRDINNLNLNVSSSANLNNILKPRDSLFSRSRTGNSYINKYMFPACIELVRESIPFLKEGDNVGFVLVADEIKDNFYKKNGISKEVPELHEKKLAYKLDVGKPPIVIPYKKKYIWQIYPILISKKDIPLQLEAMKILREDSDRIYGNDNERGIIYIPIKYGSYMWNIGKVGTSNPTICSSQLRTGITPLPFSDISKDMGVCSRVGLIDINVDYTGSIIRPLF